MLAREQRSVPESDATPALESTRPDEPSTKGEAQGQAWRLRGGTAVLALLRHAYASMLATDLALPATTLARLTGHADAGFTLRVYARDGRDEAAVVGDVLLRAARAGIGA